MNWHKNELHITMEGMELCLETSDSKNLEVLHEYLGGWVMALIVSLVIFRPFNLSCSGRKIIICVAFFSKFCQISTFYSILHFILRFTKEEAEVRKQALPFVPARYIRTFDVIFEVNCILLQRKQRFENKRSQLSQHAVSELSTLYPKSGWPLGQKFLTSQKWSEIEPRSENVSDQRRIANYLLWYLLGVF